VFVIEGRRAASGETVLWLLDGGPAERARLASEEAAKLRELVDAIPVPIWRRDCDHAVVDCNSAYASALDAPRALVLAEGHELAPAGGIEKALESATDLDRRNSHLHVVIGGSRRLLDIVELPCADEGAIGFAVDRTDVESAETELRRHVAAHAEVLESIGAAVAIYGADQRLKFFNTAFATLWGLETEWLAAEPSFGDVLECLRERRRIPEHADFRAFKRRRLQLFTSLIHRQQELMHLPDDRTFLLSVSPHPLGGLRTGDDDRGGPPVVRTLPDRCGPYPPQTGVELCRAGLRPGNAAPHRDRPRALVHRPRERRHRTDLCPCAGNCRTHRRHGCADAGTLGAVGLMPLSRRLSCRSRNGAPIR
jgi:PAS domain-containing protein